MDVILVIADEESICESLRAALPETSLVLTESRVSDGLRRMITIKADVVILDDAPSLGRGAIQAIKDAFQETPVIVLTSRGDAETRASYVLGGAAACVVKPFSCDDLLSAVNEARKPAPKVERIVSDAPAVDTSLTNLGQYQRALRWLGRVGLYSEHPKDIADRVVESVTDIFDAIRCAVVLETRNAFRIVASAGVPEHLVNELRLDISSGLMNRLERIPSVFDVLTHRDSRDAAKELEVLGMRIAAPMMCGGRMFGAILIGERSSGIPYRGDDHELLSVIGQSAAQVFEKAKQYRHVSRQQKRLDTVLANVQAGVVTVKPDRTVSMINPSAERVLQLRAIDVLGKSVQKLGSSFADIVIRTLQDEKPRLRQVVFDYAIQSKLGLSVTPLGAEGAVVIFSALPKDKVSTEEIAYSPFWEHLASRVAQEIKNPMVAISTFAQLLPKKYDSKEFRTDFAEVVQKEIARINNVVETLYRFAERPRLTLQPAKLHDTVVNVLKAFQTELDSKDIKVEVSWDDNEPDVDIDHVFISQAIHNVIQNSIEAMPEGGVLRVSTRSNNGDCELRIADSGDGISDEDARQVFLPFFSTKETGMGLGLTVANRIVQQHEGDLRLAVNEQGGTAFELVLPKGGRTNGNGAGG